MKIVLLKKSNLSGYRDWNKLVSRHPEVLDVEVLNWVESPWLGARYTMKHEAFRGLPGKALDIHARFTGVLGEDFRLATPLDIVKSRLCS